MIFTQFRPLRNTFSLAARFVSLMAVCGVSFLSGHKYAIATQAIETPDGLPVRAPGMWRMTTVAPEIGMQSGEVCIEANDKIIGASGADCEQPAVEKAQDGVIVTITCVRSETKEVTSLYFTGDFKKSYRAQSRTTLTNMKSGASIRTAFTIEANFLTSNCAGLR